MKKIEKLTPEQEAELPAFRQRYLDIACGGGRIDRDTLQGHLTASYALIGKPAPALFIFDSPAACMLALKIFKMPEASQLGSQLGSQLWSQLWSQLRSQNIYDPNYLWGSQDLYWLAFYRFAHSIGAKYSKKDAATLGLIEGISTQCEWWFPYDGVVIASERPTSVRWDGERRLHCETGPAVEYADGYALYSWRGISIPAEWIKDGPPASKDIMRIENTEQRRIAAEMRGWHNILPEIGAILIDKHANPQVGELWQADLPDNGPERFLKVQCGTGRTFAIPVGMEFATAREANAATYGIAPQILDQLEIRT